MFLRPPVIGMICALAVCVCSILPFIGCAPTAQPEPIPQQPVTLYDDGVYRVELVGCENTDVVQESDGTLLTLCFTNNSLEDIALSSVLGMKVSTTDGQTCELVPEIKENSRQPLDGLVPSGACREGDIIVKTPAEVTGFTVDLAVDFLNDEWISFEITR